MYIYKITNRANGRVYIGLTRRSVRLRFYEHIYDSSHGGTTKLDREIKKFGAQAFSVEQLKQCSSLHELARLERHYIAKYRSLNPRFGYNVRNGNGNTVTWRCAPPRSRIRRRKFAAAVLFVLYTWLWVAITGTDTKMEQWVSRVYLYLSGK